MTYNADSIKILKGLEAVRLRPGMYIGSTGPQGLHHLINEVVDNSVDEFLNGHCDTIIVKMLENNGVMVSDNGRGIPVDIHPEEGVSALRIILSTLHAGGKFEGNAISGGLHGVGVAVVNALSKKFIGRVYRDNMIYEDIYSKGIPENSLENGMVSTKGNTDKVGTEILFYPDESIFGEVKFNDSTIKKRLKELAYLNTGLKLVFIDLEGREEVFEEKEGLIGLLKTINKDEDKATEIIYLEGKVDNSKVKIAMQYIKDYNESIYSYCNNINTHEGGTHVSGFRAALTRTINAYARELGSLKDKDENFTGRDVRNGLRAVISIEYPQPEFEGQTKSKLGSMDARSIVDDVVSQEIRLYLDRNVSTLEKIIKRAEASVKLRKVEEKTKENILGADNRLQVNKKLASCSSRTPSKNELFIVEGDSAGGSAKQGRNRNYQAILPLKGKILNIEKQSLDRALNNLEITTLISVLGTGIGENFEIDNLKYHKIIIMTDADIDGSHIRTLLLTLFYRYMPALIKEGHVYIAMPPLYKVSSSKEEIYLYSDEELETYTKDKENLNIQRYKGLGEMNPEQLWDTTLNPKTRALKKVTIDDLMEADMVTSMLMGNRVPPRRKFIWDNAHKLEADLLDI